MKKKIIHDDEIMYLDFKEIEYFINEGNNLSLEQLLLIWNKALKMKFNEQSISKIKNKVEKELDNINNLYEIKRIQKKMYDLSLDTSYINKLKKKLLLNDLQNPNSNLGQMFKTIINNSKEK